MTISTPITSTNVFMTVDSLWLNHIVCCRNLTPETHLPGKTSSVELYPYTHWWILEKYSTTHLSFNFLFWNKVSLSHPGWTWTSCLSFLESWDDRSGHHAYLIHIFKFQSPNSVAVGIRSPSDEHRGHIQIIAPGGVPWCKIRNSVSSVIHP